MKLWFILAVTVALLAPGAARAAESGPRLFLRFRPVNATNLYARVWVAMSTPPWRNDLGALPPDADNVSTLRVARGEPSPWIEVTSPEGSGSITLIFGPEPLEAIAATIELAPQADEQAIFRTIEASEPGNRVTLVVPPGYEKDPNSIVTVGRRAQERLRAAQRIAADLRRSAAAPPTPLASIELQTTTADSLVGGNTPPGPATQFPLMAIAPYGLGVYYSDPQTLNQELECLRLQGFNTLAVTPASVTGNAAPAINAQTRALLRGFHATADCLPVAEALTLKPGSAIDTGERPTAAMFSAVSALVRVRGPEHAAPLNNVTGGEPPFTSDGRAADTALPLPTYLATRGRRSADFAVASLDRVAPTPDRERLLDAAESDDPVMAAAAQNALTWTDRYHAYVASLALAALLQRNPPREIRGLDAPVLEDFFDRPLLVGAGLWPGGLDHPPPSASQETPDYWTADWMFDCWESLGPALQNRSAYLLDFFHVSIPGSAPAPGNAAGRSEATAFTEKPEASRNPGGAPAPIVWLRMPANGIDLRIQAFTAIGHGAKAIGFFDFGPLYAGASAGRISDFASRCRGMMELTRDLGRAQGLILSGRPPTRQVALIHITTGELSGPSWSVAQERQFIHLALTSAQFDADVLTDQAALMRDLSPYKVIYLCDTQTPAALLTRLSEWVDRGGTLCLTARAGTEDEFGRGNPALNQLAGASVIDRDLSEPGVPSTDKLIFNAQALGPLYGSLREAPVAPAFRQTRFENLKGATVLAALSDGRPAALLHPMGKGRVITLCYSPGMHVFHSMSQAFRAGGDAQDSAGEGRESFRGVVDLNSAAAGPVTFPCLLANVTPGVEMSDHVLSAELLESDRGGVVLLAAASATPIRDLRLKVAISDVRSVESLAAGKLPFATAPGRTIFMLPALTQTDIVLLHR